jgi:dual specificity MAP kinase phosphatase
VFTAPSDARDASALDLSATVRILEELHVRAERADDAFPSRVLVYCMTGHSRAPSIAVAYLMYSERRRLRDAVVALARRYPRGHTAVKIKPCDYQHLEAFEKTLFGENTV